MLNARNVIIFTVVLAVLSLAGAIIELALPPDGGGLRADSYGTRASGLRALLETLEELKVPVERGLVPPGGIAQREVTLLLWNPDPEMVQVEPAHLQHLAQWVRRGGQIVIAPPLRRPEGGLPFRQRMGLAHEQQTALEALGLGDVLLESFDSAKGVPAPRKEHEGVWWTQKEERPFASLPVSCQGSLSYLKNDVKTLQAPSKDLQVIQSTSGPTPSGRIVYIDKDKTERTLVAAYPIEKGSIVVIAEPALFKNSAFARDDNAPLAALLFHDLGRPVVIDEFYHGLTVRGNAAWLLTRHPYGLLAALLLLATALWAWREAVHLGPPLNEKPPSRRVLGEYVEAMAGLFYRAGCRPFVLEELRDGTLWRLRKKLSLSPKHENAEELAKVLARKDPAAAERLASAVAEVDGVLAGKKPATDVFFIQAARKISQCL